VNRNLVIPLLIALVVGLPFAFRRPQADSGWREGDPVLVAVSPHNEAIRQEFAQAFSRWHEEHHGRPVKLDWRSIGGTTEIARYLTGEMAAQFKAWRRRQGTTWPSGAADAVFSDRFDTSKPPADPAAAARHASLAELHAQLRATDDPQAFHSGIDLFWGGGAYDHDRAARQGLTVPAWPAGQEPVGTLRDAEGRELIPSQLGGETLVSRTWYGGALSSFGICYNLDRLRDLGLPAPRQWADLVDARYFGQIGVADPTKSASVAKAFEMIVHQQMDLTVTAAGYSRAQVDAFEAAFAASKGLAAGALPEGVPTAYQTAVEEGWSRGVALVQLICANARYLTDSSSKIPIDVSMANCAAGLAIDFYGRYQGEVSRGPDGAERMIFITPTGGSGVSADPVSLLRGAPNREVARRFMEFVLREEGQRLWNYRPGTPGGPAQYPLRRLPIQRGFYPGAPDYDRHRPHLSDDFDSPEVNPYELARHFTYRKRWTGAHFTLLRDLIRAMCLDAGDELKSTWRAVLDAGGPAAQPEAMALLQRPPPGVDWRAPFANRFDRARHLQTMREWTLHFRASYREAAERIRPAS
jgi:ABC-type Fe3+ transport system substrate-binding protein